MAEKHQGRNIFVEIAPVETSDAARPATGFVSLIGRSTGFSIDGNRFDFDAEFGDVDAFWRKGSVISDRGWTVPFDAYWKDTDPAFLMVEAAVMQQTRAAANATPYLYIVVYPLGKVAAATTYAGVVTVDNFDHTFDRAGSLDTSFGFTGEGKPIIAAYTAPV